MDKMQKTVQGSGGRGRRNDSVATGSPVGRSPGQSHKTSAASPKVLSLKKRPRTASKSPGSGRGSKGRGLAPVSRGRGSPSVRRGSPTSTHRGRGASHDSESQVESASQSSQGRRGRPRGSTVARHRGGTSNSNSGRGWRGRGALSGRVWRGRASISGRGWTGARGGTTVAPGRGWRGRVSSAGRGWRGRGLQSHHRGRRAAASGRGGRGRRTTSPSGNSTDDGSISPPHTHAHSGSSLRGRRWTSLSARGRGRGWGRGSARGRGGHHGRGARSETSALELRSKPMNKAERLPSPDAGSDGSMSSDNFRSPLAESMGGADSSQEMAMVTQLKRSRGRPAKRIHSKVKTSERSASREAAAEPATNSEAEAGSISKEGERRKPGRPRKHADKTDSSPPKPRGRRLSVEKVVLTRGISGSSELRSASSGRAGMKSPLKPVELAQSATRRGRQSPRVVLQRTLRANLLRPGNSPRSAAKHEDTTDTDTDLPTTDTASAKAKVSSSSGAESATKRRRGRSSTVVRQDGLSDTDTDRASVMTEEDDKADLSSPALPNRRMTRMVSGSHTEDKIPPTLKNEAVVKPEISPQSPVGERTLKMEVEVEVEVCSPPAKAHTVLEQGSESTKNDTKPDSPTEDASVSLKAEVHESSEVKDEVESPSVDSDSQKEAEATGGEGPKKKPTIISVLQHTIAMRQQLARERESWQAGQEFPPLASMMDTLSIKPESPVMSTKNVDEAGERLNLFEMFSVSSDGGQSEDACESAAAGSSAALPRRRSSALGQPGVKPGEYTLAEPSGNDSDKDSDRKIRRHLRGASSDPKVLQAGEEHSDETGVSVGDATGALASQRSGSRRGKHGSENRLLAAQDTDTEPSDVEVSSSKGRSWRKRAEETTTSAVPPGRDVDTAETGAASAHLASASSVVIAAGQDGDVQEEAGETTIVGSKGIEEREIMPVLKPEADTAPKSLRGRPPKQPPCLDILPASEQSLSKTDTAPALATQEQVSQLKGFLGSEKTSVKQDAAEGEASSVGRLHVGGNTVLEAKRLTESATDADMETESDKDGEGDSDISEDEENSFNLVSRGTSARGRRRGPGRRGRGSRWTRTKRHISSSPRSGSVDRGFVTCEETTKERLEESSSDVTAEQRSLAAESHAKGEEYHQVATRGGRRRGRKGRWKGMWRGNLRGLGSGLRHVAGARERADEDASFTSEEALDPIDGTKIHLATESITDAQHHSSLPADDSVPPADNQALTNLASVDDSCEATADVQGLPPTSQEAPPVEGDASQEATVTDQAGSGSRLQSQGDSEACIKSLPLSGAGSTAAQGHLMEKGSSVVVKINEDGAPEAEDMHLFLLESPDERCPAVRPVDARMPSSDAESAGAQMTGSSQESEQSDLEQSQRPHTGKGRRSKTVPRKLPQQGIVKVGPVTAPLVSPQADHSKHRLANQQAMQDAPGIAAVDADGTLTSEEHSLAAFQSGQEEAVAMRVGIPGSALEEATSTETGSETQTATSDASRETVEDKPPEHQPEAGLTGTVSPEDDKLVKDVELAGSMADDAGTVTEASADSISDSTAMTGNDLRRVQTNIVNSTSEVIEPCLADSGESTLPNKTSKLSSQVDDQGPELVENQAPELVDGQAPELVDDQAPALVDDQAPELVDDRAPELVDDQAPELVDDRAPELVDESSRADVADDGQALDSLDKAEDNADLCVSDHTASNEVKDLEYIPQAHNLGDPGPAHDSAVDIGKTATITESIVDDAIGLRTEEIQGAGNHVDAIAPYKAEEVITQSPLTREVSNLAKGTDCEDVGGTDSEATVSAITQAKETDCIGNVDATLSANQVVDSHSANNPPAEKVNATEATEVSISRRRGYHRRRREPEALTEQPNKRARAEARSRKVEGNIPARRTAEGEHSDDSHIGSFDSLAQMGKSINHENLGGASDILATDIPVGDSNKGPSSETGPYDVLSRKMTTRGKKNRFQYLFTKGRKRVKDEILRHEQPQSAEPWLISDFHAREDVSARNNLEEMMKACQPCRVVLIDFIKCLDLDKIQETQNKPGDQSLSKEAMVQALTASGRKRSKKSSSPSPTVSTDLLKHGKVERTSSPRKRRHIPSSVKSGVCVEDSGQPVKASRKRMQQPVESRTSCSPHLTKSTSRVDSPADSLISDVSVTSEVEGYSSSSKDSAPMIDQNRHKKVPQKKATTSSAYEQQFLSFIGNPTETQPEARLPGTVQNPAVQTVQTMSSRPSSPKASSAKKPRFRCKFCIYTTGVRMTIEEHIYNHILNVVPFRCGICSAIFGTRSGVIVHHRKQHQRWPLTIQKNCDIDEKQFYEDCEDRFAAEHDAALAGKLTPETSKASITDGLTMVEDHLETSHIGVSDVGAHVSNHQPMVQGENTAHDAATGVGGVPSGGMQHPGRPGHLRSTPDAGNSAEMQVKDGVTAREESLSHDPSYNTELKSEMIEDRCEYLKDEGTSDGFEHSAHDPESEDMGFKIVSVCSLATGDHDDPVPAENISEATGEDQGSAAVLAKLIPKDDRQVEALDQQGLKAIDVVKQQDMTTGETHTGDPCKDTTCVQSDSERVDATDDFSVEIAVEEGKLTNEAPTTPVVSKCNHSATATTEPCMLDCATGEILTSLASTDPEQIAEKPQIKKENELIKVKRTSYGCIKCHYMTTDFNTIIHHIDKVHNLDFWFACPYCPFGSLRIRINLVRHIRRTHPKESSTIRIPIVDEGKYFTSKIVEIEVPVSELTSNEHGDLVETVMKTAVPDLSGDVNAQVSDVGQEETLVKDIAAANDDVGQLEDDLVGEPKTQSRPDFLQEAGIDEVTSSTVQSNSTAKEVENADDDTKTKEDAVVVQAGNEDEAEDDDDEDVEEVIIVTTEPVKRPVQFVKPTAHVAPAVQQQQLDDSPETLNSVHLPVVIQLDDADVESPVVTLDDNSQGSDSVIDLDVSSPDEGHDGAELSMECENIEDARLHDDVEEEEVEVEPQRPASLITLHPALEESVHLPETTFTVTQSSTAHDNHADESVVDDEDPTVSASSDTDSMVRRSTRVKTPKKTYVPSILLRKTTTAKTQGGVDSDSENPAEPTTWQVGTVPSESDTQVTSVIQHPIMSISAEAAPMQTVSPQRRLEGTAHTGTSEVTGGPSQPNDDSPVVSRDSQPDVLMSEALNVNCTVSMPLPINIVPTGGGLEAASSLLTTPLSLVMTSVEELRPRPPPLIPLGVVEASHVPGRRVTQVPPLIRAPISTASAVAFTPSPVAPSQQVIVAPPLRPPMVTAASPHIHTHMQQQAPFPSRRPPNSGAGPTTGIVRPSPSQLIRPPPLTMAPEPPMSAADRDDDEAARRAFSVFNLKPRVRAATLSQAVHSMGRPVVSNSSVAAPLASPSPQQFVHSLPPRFSRPPLARGSMSSPPVPHPPALHRIVTRPGGGTERPRPAATPDSEAIQFKQFQVPRGHVPRARAAAAAGAAQHGLLPRGRPLHPATIGPPGRLPPPGLMSAMAIPPAAHSAPRLAIPRIPHGNSFTGKCPHCMYQTDHREQMYAHLVTHNLEKIPYTCPYCSVPNQMNKMFVEKHMRNCHPYQQIMFVPHGM